MEYKTCNGCKEIKPVTDFSFARKGIRAYLCKACENTRRRGISLAKKDGSYVNPRALEARAAKFKLQGLETHKGAYEYDKVVYKGNLEKVEITCLKHGGTFWQTPGAHLSGNGCVVCYGESHKERGKKNRLTQEEFERRAREAHGDTYDLSEAKYVWAKTHVDVRCTVHGVFSILPHNLFAGHGCPECQSYGFNKGKPASIYVLKCDDLVKIGITNRDVKERVANINNDSGKNFQVVYSQFSEDGCIALSTEWAMKLFLRTQYSQPNYKFDGFTECYYNADVDMIIRMIKQHKLNMEYINDNH